MLKRIVKTRNIKYVCRDLNIWNFCYRMASYVYGDTDVLTMIFG